MFQSAWYLPNRNRGCQAVSLRKVQRWHPNGHVSRLQGWFYLHLNKKLSRSDESSTKSVQVGLDHPLCSSALLLPSHPHLAAADLLILLLPVQLQIPGLCPPHSARTRCFGLWRAGWRTPPFSCCALGVLRFLGRRSSSLGPVLAPGFSGKE